MEEEAKIASQSEVVQQIRRQAGLAPITTSNATSTETIGMVSTRNWISQYLANPPALAKASTPP